MPFPSIECGSLDWGRDGEGGGILLTLTDERSGMSPPLGPVIIDLGISISEPVDCMLGRGRGREREEEDDSRR